MDEHPRLFGSAGLPVALVGLLFVGFMVVNNLRMADWDITVYIAVGEDSGDIRQYAEDRLGDVYLRDALGHDGKFFFVQSNDPWVLDPSENARYLDRPHYRSQRMLYPVLAGGAGLFGPQTIVYTMVALNVIALVLGGWVTAGVVLQMGMSRWWGLAFPLNIGFIGEMNVGGAGAIAGVFAFAAVALFLKNRSFGAIACLTFAALAREAMLIAAAGSAWWLWRFRREKMTAVWAIATPLGAVATWFMYLRIRLGWQTGAHEIQEIGLPFVGFFQALRVWLERDILSLVVGLLLLAVFAGFTARVLRGDHLVGWAFVGFVGLGLLMTRQVWLRDFDIARAVAPAITAYVLLIFAARNRVANVAEAGE